MKSDKDQERIDRAKRLVNLIQFEEWEDFASLVKEKIKSAHAAFYATQDSFTAAKYLGYAKGLDKALNLIQDEIGIVKKILDSKK